MNGRAMTHSVLLLGLALLLGGCPFGIFDGVTEAPTGPVRLSTDQDTYAAGEVITITITNESDTSISAYDQQAFCSILRLDQQVEKGWNEIRNCNSTRPSRLVTISAETTRTIKLDPAQAATEPLAEGRYRAVLVYSLGRDFSFADSSSVQSGRFEVN